MGKIRFAMAFHDHQPVGNFDGVVEQSYVDAYLPFLEVMERYPQLRFAVHTSGSLMDWLVQHKPQYV
ncbi:MAG: 4-alpha-glucanotransferase, partial [Planctomycetia bacterium]